MFPLQDGERSTTATGQAVFADAARAVDPRLAEEIAAADGWYRSYVPFARRLLEAELVNEVDVASVPEAGLRSIHDRFRYLRDGDETSVLDAVRRGGDELATVTVEGQGDAHPGELTVPYRGELLRGDRLHRQLDAWLDAGTAEPSFVEAIRGIIDHPDHLDLSDRTVVVLGAGAEMGPLSWLCAWGAHVHLVDLPEPTLWERILGDVHAGIGRASIPVRAPTGDLPDDDRIAEVAGADLVTELPEIATWLGHHVDGPLTVGNYVYADGALNVRVSVAVDALVGHLSSIRDDVSTAVLATPTDVYAVPAETREDSLRRLGDTGPWPGLVRSLTGGRLYVPNHGDQITTPKGKGYGIADSLVPQQGPNYAFAKRLHRWRARLHRARGHVSSINVAPPTRTLSVTRNRLLAAAYRSAPRYGVEVFEPETSRALMAAMLVHDLREPSASANPEAELGHPLEQLSEGAIHGGLWRIPFAPRTVLPLAVLRGMAREVLPGRS